ncbi:MAG: transporter substrate-binding domain-containing protein [Alkalimonas sp.]|nr:transporter substrate-binding domain-containing protein [Alkalimonas sp.]
MLRLGIALLTLLYLLPLNAHQHPELEWCLDDHPYWHFYPDDGEPYGQTVDLMQTIAERAGIKLRYSPNTPFYRCLQQMQLGQTDLMASLHFSSERAKFMHFIPYDKARPEAIFLLKETTDITSWQDLLEVRVGIIKDYFYTDELNQQLAINHRKTVEVERLDDAFALLLLGKVDAVIGPAQSSINVIQHNPRFHQRFKQASYQFIFNHAQTINLAMSRLSPHQELLPKFQQVVEQMVENGEVEKYRIVLTSLD